MPPMLRLGVGPDGLCAMVKISHQYPRIWESSNPCIDIFSFAIVKKTTVKAGWSGRGILIAVPDVCAGFTCIMQVHAYPT